MTGSTLESEALLNQVNELEFKLSAFQRIRLNKLPSSEAKRHFLRYGLLTVERLIKAYTCLLDKPSRVETLEVLQEEIEQSLRPSIKKSSSTTSLEASGIFRNSLFVHSNFLRLLLLRGKRLYESIEGISKLAFSSRSASGVSALDVVFKWLAWAFYIPRLLLNLVLIAKHVIPHPWMSEEEKALGFFTRLQYQLKKRWFQLGNDFIWALTGVLTGFVLSTPVGQLATVALFLYDVIAMYLSRRQAQSQLQQAIDNFSQQIKEQEDRQLRQALELQLELMKQEHHDRTRQLNFDLGITIGLFTGMLVAFGAPAIGAIASGVLGAGVISVLSGPLMPVIGMSLVVLMCLLIIGYKYLYPAINNCFAKRESPPEVDWTVEDDTAPSLTLHKPQVTSFILSETNEAQSSPSHVQHLHLNAYQAEVRSAELDLSSADRLVLPQTTSPRATPSSLSSR